GFLADLPHGPRKEQRLRRKLEREHRTRFFLWGSELGTRDVADVADIGAGIDRLAELHRLRFQGRAEGHSFSSPEYLAFHRDLAARYHRAGRLRLYGLEVDGVVVAMLYCFRDRDRIYYFQGGFDPAYARWSVGQLLVCHAIERSVAEGARRFDFLK